ncbi:MAG: nucleotide exchange factor GrpE, partial [Leeuwenhoekiella sp.]|nr:nucleotide exchange factor GrpE [Leeuwenhoekiella sp.]
MSSENREDIINDQEDLNVETNLEGTEVSEDELTAEDQIANLQVELDKEKDKFLRLFAEFENYKRRTSKERVEMFKTAGQEVLQAMLPVLDDFDRAAI